MELGWRSTAIVTGLAAATVVVQLTVASQVGLFGAELNIVPVTVAACGFFAGPVGGAAAGFASGVFLDFLSGATAGVSSLVLTLLGFAVGRWRELRDPGNTLVALPLGAAAVFAYGAGFTAVSFLLDPGDVARVSWLLARDLVAGALLGAAAGLPLFALVRKVLRPVLAVDPLERRRRREIRRTGPVGLRGLDI
jgi:rod shape-determining protein MreD